MSPRPIDVVLGKLGDTRKTSNGWTARCPAHDDRTPSLSVSEGEDGRVLLKCHAGCTAEEICAALGLTLRDLYPRQASPVQDRAATPLARRRKVYPTREEAVAAAARSCGGERMGEWVYHYADGREAFFVARFHLQRQGRDGKCDKVFRPFHCTNAGWAIADPPGPLPLFGLPDMASARRIYVVEGEKCVQAARGIGLVATTSAHGAKTAKKSDWTPLAGREVILLPDNDSAGDAYARSVQQTLRDLDPKPSVRTVRLPDLPEHGDIVDLVALRRASGCGNDTIREEIEMMADTAQRCVASPVDSTPVLTRLCDVQPEQVAWLWPRWIPLGKLTLIAGDPGLGKSLVVLDIAARVTRGLPLPDGKDTPNPAGGVVILNAEDGLSDTVRPRLEAAGADVHRINILAMVRRRDASSEEAIDVPFSLTRDLAALDQAIDQTPGCLLVIIDPITPYLGGVDSHVNAEVRGALHPLAELAARRGVAVLAVTHLNKAGATAAIYRATGSLAFVAAARASYLITKDQGDSTGRRRLFLPVKNNLAVDVSGMAFSVAPGPDATTQPTVAWEANPVTTSADEALLSPQAHPRAGTRLSQAMEWLKDELAAGPVAEQEVAAGAKACGISQATLRRAREALGIIVRKQGFDGGWYWALPASAAEDARSATDEPDTLGVSTFAELEHLRAERCENGGAGTAAAPQHDEDVQAGDGERIRVPAPVDGESCEMREWKD